jgi:hypothetical protein
MMYYMSKSIFFDQECPFASLEETHRFRFQEHVVDLQHNNIP